MPDFVLWFSNANPAVQVSTVALVVSGISALIGVGGLTTAILSFRVARRQEKRKHPRLEYTYLDGSRTKTSTNDTEYRVAVNVTNPTETQNAVRAVELEISYAVDGRMVGLRIDPVRAAGTLTVPVTVAGGSSTQGNLVFAAKRDLLKELNPEGYLLRFRDTYGVVTTVPVGHLIETAEVSG